MSKKVLIKSISGIRGIVGNGLDPEIIVKYAAAFGTFLKKGKVVIGQDSRPSGEMVKNAVKSGLVSTGIDVVDIGIVPTPTVEVAVKDLKAVGGICITASHNSTQWNALKFFNKTGEFITPAEYKKLNSIFESENFLYVPVTELGQISYQDNWIDIHIKKVFKLRTISVPKIGRKKFKIVVDAINGAGSIALPLLLERMGAKVIKLNCNNDGNFVHEPEPVAKNLTQLSKAVKKHKADIGMACDPDADRLALVDENGMPIGEELTLTIAVKHVLKKSRKNVVINLSTSKTTADIAKQSNRKIYYSKVGESNVVQMMRAKKAGIGGEGNGGVIYPECHAGRDALVGAALVLSCLAEEKLTLSSLVETFPKYFNIKTKAPLKANFKTKLKNFEKEAFKLLGKVKIDRRDGLRFDFKEGWLQIRSSNTEPIFRLIVETSDKKLTDSLLNKVKKYFR
ncbi:MAG: phosphoglucosamine mutase [Candidatus Zixiibacteriota bacterium]|nr:MAG: phosphoglucosamine mutase [candidate division Zixibacteria bacterium]